MMDCASRSREHEAPTAEVTSLKMRLDSLVKICSNIMTQSEMVAKDMQQVQQEVASHSQRFRELEGWIQAKDQQDHTIMSHLRETRDPSQTSLLSDACRALESRLRMELKHDVNDVEHRQQLMVKQVYDDLHNVSSKMDQQLNEYKQLLEKRSNPPPWIPVNDASSKSTIGKELAVRIGNEREEQYELERERGIVRSSKPPRMIVAEIGEDDKKVTNAFEASLISNQHSSSLDSMVQEQEKCKTELSDMKRLINELNLEEMHEMYKEWKDKQVSMKTEATTPSATNGCALHSSISDAVDLHKSADDENGMQRYTSLQHGFQKVVDSVAISESTWEVTPLIGTPAFGFGGSFVVLGVLILNVVVQFVFCIVALTSLTDDDFNAESLGELEKWRLDAHGMEFVDRITQLTMVSRVCDLDKSLSLSTNQVLIAESISKYVKVSGLTLGAPAGVLMCMLALMVWFLTIMKELNSMYGYLRAILHLETGPIKIRRTNNDTYELQVLNILRKMACCAITVLRLTVAGFLVFVGAQSIIFTNSVSDLLLNALALELILNIDEYLFSCLAPKSAQKFVSELEPLPAHGHLAYHGITVQTIASPLIVFTSLVITFYVGVKPHLHDIERAERILCSGNQDFAYVVDARGFAHATSNFVAETGGVVPSGELNQLVKDGLQRASWDSVLATDLNNMLAWSYDISSLDELNVGGVNAAERQLQHSCTDLLTQTACNSNAVFLHPEGGVRDDFFAKCPPGYMNPRKPSECRDVAIELKMWNSSQQEQKARSAYSPDIEVSSALSRPCRGIRNEGNRTVWLEGSFGTGGEGFCTCQPKTATAFRRYATLANSVPISDCTQLADMGACVFENPAMSGSHDNATLTHFLCPEACGCSLRPVSPFRTKNCPETCRSQSFIINRGGCRDAEASEIADSLQLRYFKEDVLSMKNPGGIHPFFLEELGRIGCEMVTHMQSPYTRGIEPPCQLDVGLLSPFNEYGECLKHRCQDANATICKGPEGRVTLQEWCNSYEISEELPTTFFGVWCPKTCGWCIELPVCSDVGSSSDLYYATGGYGLAHFFRGFCPQQCNCQPWSPNKFPGCPLECVQ